MVHVQGSLSRHHCTPTGTAESGVALQILDFLSKPKHSTTPICKDDKQNLSEYRKGPTAHVHLNYLFRIDAPNILLPSATAISGEAGCMYM